MEALIAKTPAQKAWETRRARALASGAPLPAPKPKAANVDGLSPAQRAWATRRAALLASGATIPAPKAAPKAAPEATAKPKPAKALVERVSALAPEASELSAAQKAAAARKANDAARAEIAARKAGTDEPSKFKEGDMVSLWTDDESGIGCGIRQFLVIEIGPRMVRLFNAPALREIEVDRLTFEKHATIYTSPKGRVAAIIARNASEADKLGLEYSPREVKRAAALASA